MQKTYKVNGLLDLDNVAKDILLQCKNDRVFALEGEMGAGKTTFTRALCKALNCEDEICSPTFAIVNVYFSEKAGEVYHFDFYRLKHPDEAYEIGIEDAFADGICFIEWPEKIGSLLPKTAIHIVFSNTDEGRQIEIKD